MTTPALGLRERKKAATRQALHEAAVRLAAERGPDNVTVEAIADAADVSRRTFSNYFASRDDALLHGDTERLQRLVVAVAARPETEGAWTALRRAVADLLAAEDADSAAAERMRVVRSHPSLLPARVARYGAAERTLAGVLAERVPGPDPELRSRVLAAVFLAAFRSAGQVALERPGSSAATLLDEALAGLGDAMA